MTEAATHNAKNGGRQLALVYKSGTSETDIDREVGGVVNACKSAGVGFEGRCEALRAAGWTVIPIPIDAPVAILGDAI